MPRRKKEPATVEKPLEPTPQPITETLEKNYMPYIVTAITARAIPEIDGFKPSQRRLLYTMYKNGLLSGARVKSATIVGDTMHIHPHGESIYETMVRLTRGNEALLHPFVDSKGSFGKQYSRDMKYAAPRYTEVKLDTFAAECFRGIDKNAVDMIPSYDNTTVEPRMLPTTFPNVLVSPNMGIAVGMASNICSFNLGEICDATAALLKNPNLSVEKLMEILKAPDFPGGGDLLYDEAAIRKVYEYGTGQVRLRSRYSYDKAACCIDILEIPYSTSIEVIINRIADLVKAGKLKEINDFRDEIDLSGFKLTIDLRRGTDPDALMRKLFKQTALEDTFKCNFNILIDGQPKQCGVIEILSEWIRFRKGCVVRELSYDLERKKEKLHLLLGLGKLLLDIDKAIKIIRETEKESGVVPNLMSGFGIDQIQAEYIAEIKLRHLNREYILERIREIESLRGEIASLTDLISDDFKIKSYIIKQLGEIKAKYGKPRKTHIVYEYDEPEDEKEEAADESVCVMLMTREGYIKRLTEAVASKTTEDAHKLKDGDELRYRYTVKSSDEILVFTDRAQVYKARVDDFDYTKPNALGDYAGGKLGFEEGERPIMMCVPDYKSDANIIFTYENGKGVRVPVSAYETKTNRKKLTAAYSDASPCACAFYESEPTELVITVDGSRAAIISSELIPIKTTRSSAGVNLVSLNAKKNQRVSAVIPLKYADIENVSRYKKTKIPAPTTVLNSADVRAGQLSIE